MKSLIIYDSHYGNTEKIAQSIAQGLPQARLINVTDFQPKALDNVSLLIVGSPTNGGRPTEQIQQLLDSLPPQRLASIKTMAFDTRFATDAHGFGLKLLMKTIGFAAEKISRMLTEKGGEEVAKPEGFIVKDKEGPLISGELARAKSWAEQAVYSQLNEH